MITDHVTWLNHVTKILIFLPTCTSMCLFSWKIACIQFTNLYVLYVHMCTCIYLAPTALNKGSYLLLFRLLTLLANL